MTPHSQTLTAAAMPAQAQQEAQKLRRRVARFRHAGLFSGCGPDVTIQCASTAQDLAQAYALVHDVFVERGFIAPHPSGMRLRTFEALPEMATFVAKAQGRVIAVTSVVPDSPDLGLPSDKAFHHELISLRAAGRRVCEITNLAVHPDYRKTPVFFELTRCCLAHAMATEHSDMFIAISPEHARFFEEVFLFDPCGDRRSYCAEVLDIVEGKRLDLLGLQQRAIQRDALLEEEAFLNDFFYELNPYHGLVWEWAQEARVRFAQPSLLRRLFVDSGFLDECDEESMWSIRQRWGERLLGELWPGRGPWLSTPQEIRILLSAPRPRARTA